MLADDHAVVRQGFRRILEQEPDFHVVAEAGQGREAIRLTQELTPDIVIMDVAMPELNGVEATRRIMESCPKCRVLILSMHKDAVYVRESLRAGAKGYLLKDAIDQDLLAAVYAIARGDSFLSPAVASMVLNDYREQVTDPLDLLTAREREILQMLAEGKTAKDIACSLDLSVHTVDAHRGRLMKKLDLHSTGELVRLARRKGLIQ